MIQNRNILDSGNDGVLMKRQSEPEREYTLSTDIYQFKIQIDYKYIIL